MKLLILGASGMAGHVMHQYFQKTDYEVLTTTRNGVNGSYALHAENETQVQQLILSVKPDIVINCIGILNEHATIDPAQAIAVNSLLPHYLVSLLDGLGSKLIHISTDCVFTGKKGDYTEQDIPDGTSMYARTKILGEINSPHHLTIRSSIIGPELKEGIGLFHWFMKQEGNVKGYQNVFWNGVTTLELAKVVEKAIEQKVSGLYHLTAPEKISKYKLLQLFQQVYAKNDVVILPDAHIVLDRTLKNTRDDFNYTVPSYLTMIEEMKIWKTNSED